MKAFLQYRPPLKQRVFLHLIFWVSYFLFFVFQYKLIYTSYKDWQWAVSLSITIWPDIFAAYFTNYVLLPHFLYKKKIPLFATGLILSAAAMILLQRVLIIYVDYPIIMPEKAAGLKFWDFNPFYALVNIYSVVALFTVIKLMKDLFHSQQERTDLENQNKTSELALLRSQINPHFFFNTLNNIDALILSNPDHASEAIIRLSDIMRYMLYDTNSDQVLLEKEINYLNSYIELQRIRIKNPENIHFEHSNLCGSMTIAPMLFVPFIENAFKHGSKVPDKARILIRLSCTKQMLIFEVENRFETRVGQQKDQTAGIGLNNVKRRLKLLYPGKHQLQIVQTEDNYKVHLEIQTAEL